MVGRGVINQSCSRPLNIIMEQSSSPRGNSTLYGVPVDFIATFNVLLSFMLNCDEGNVFLMYVCVKLHIRCCDL